MRLRPAGFTGNKSLDNEDQFMINLSNRLDHEDCYFHLSSSAPNNPFINTNIVGHDKIKLLEQKICDLIDESSVAAEDARYDIALARARDAQDTLNQLKLNIVQQQEQQRSNSSMSNYSSSLVNEDSAASVRDTPPMTTNVNIFDLSIMVRSNLALQLRNNNLLDESLEIYTQICKSVGNSNSSMGVDALMLSSTKTTGSNADGGNLKMGSKFYLYRFGMNIGNILFEMGEYQRALKYFRLTLDRLSSSPGNQQIRIKLINNIAITLVCMHANRPTNDVINSFSQLLADNLQQQQQQEHPQQQQPQPQQATSNKAIFEPINANHHKFLLNMMVCLYQRSDLQSMVSILKTHVNIGINRKYTKVSNYQALHTTDELHIESDELERLISAKEAETNRCLITSCQLLLDLAARQAAGSRQANLGLGFCLRLLTSSEHYKHLTLDLKTSFVADLLMKRGQLNEAIRLLEHIALEHQQQAIASNHNKTARPTTATGSNKRAGSAKTSQTTSSGVAIGVNTRQLAGSLTIGCKSSKVLANISQLYSLRMNQAEALELAEQAIEVDRSYAGNWINLAICHYYMKNLQQAEKCYKQALSLLFRDDYDNDDKINARCDNDRSHCIWLATYNLVALNRKLGRHLDDLDELVRKTGLKMMDDGDVRATGGTKNDGYGDNNDNSETVRLTKLLYHQMYLLPLQVGLLYQQSNMTKQALFVLNELVSRQHNQQQAQSSPEIYIQLSKLMIDQMHEHQGHQIDHDMQQITTTTSSPPTNNKHQAQSANSKQPINLLHFAVRVHSYHLPLAERLIALYINDFDYKAAENIIMDCIKNRPDQVKWYQMLAECYRRSADYKEAANIYRLAIDLFPLDTSCLKALVNLNAELGLTDESKFYEAKLERALNKLGELTN